MPGQMSLFPADETPDKKKTDSEADANVLDEMFRRTPWYRDPGNFVDMIGFIARFPQYSALNCFLLHSQRPEATYVASPSVWEKRYNRRLTMDARPMVILAPMSPVRFVYDLTDTQGEEIAENLLQPYERKDRIQSDILNKTIRNCAFHGIAVHKVAAEVEDTKAAISLTYDIRRKYRELGLDSRAKYLILLDESLPIEDAFSALVYRLAHIFCGHLGIDDQAWWPDRRGSDQARADMEAACVAYLVCRRKGLVSASERYLGELPDREEKVVPVFGLSGVFQATQYIEDMAKTHWKSPKKKSRYQPESTQ